jgi:hypothetical protein
MNRRLVIPVEQLHVFANMRAEVFYKTQQWRETRYLALKHLGSRCQLCGAVPGEGISLHVDHIRPRYLYPEHCLSFENLQILCNVCHQAKGTTHVDDFRKGQSNNGEFEYGLLRDFFRVKRGALTLENRPPSDRFEVEYLTKLAVTPKKTHRKRWNTFIRFCHREKRTYKSACHLCVDDVMSSKMARDHHLKKFLHNKSPSDYAFDIAGCLFPPSLIDLIRDGE